MSKISLLVGIVFPYNAIDQCVSIRLTVYTSGIGRKQSIVKQSELRRQQTDQWCKYNKHSQYASGERIKVKVTGIVFETVRIEYSPRDCFK